MNFALYISNKRIDLFQDETIVLNRQVKDLQSVDGVFSDYTQDFTLPASEKNNEIFSHYYNVDVVGGFNAHFAVDAKIEIHGLQVFTGVIELVSVNFKVGEPQSYNVVFYGDGKKLSSVMGEETLQNIDLSAYDHTATLTNIENSWNGNLHSGAIVYPLIAWARSFNYSYMGINNNIRVPSGQVVIEDLKPAIRLRDLVTKCLNNYGYTTQGSFFTNGITDELFVCPSPTAGSLRGQATEPTCNITGSDFSITSSSFYYWKDQTYDTEVNDPASVFDMTTYLYTAQGSGTYTFIYSTSVDTITALNNDAQNIELGIFVNNTLRGNPITLTTTGTQSHTWLLNLNAGDVVDVRIRSNTACSLSSRVFRCSDAPIGFAGSTISMSNLMPNTKVNEFLGSILKTFNAVLVPVDETRIDIELMDSWLDSSNIRIWTDYVDLQIGHHKKVEVPKFISMKHKESEDLVNETFRKQLARDFGSASTSPNIDFGKDELSIESIFSVVPPTYINDVNGYNQKVGVTDLQVMQIVDSKGDPATTDLLLFYYNGLVACSSRWYFEGSQKSSYPQASVFSDSTPTTTSYSVAFSLEAVLIGTPPLKTIFDTCWLKYISRIYSSQSRIVEYEAFIPVGEWINMSLNDTIAISGYTYKIDSISYDLAQEKAKLVLYTYPKVELSSFDSYNDNTIAIDTPTSNDEGLTFIGIGDQLAKLGNSTNTTGTLSLAGHNLTNPATLQTSIDSLISQVQTQMIVLELVTGYVAELTTTYVSLNFDTLHEYNVVDMTGDTTNDLITIDSSGLYAISATIAIGESGGNSKIVAITINDTEVVTRSWHTQAGSAFFGTTLNLNTNDEIKLKAKVANGSHECDVDISKLEVIKL